MERRSPLLVIPPPAWLLIFILLAIGAGRLLPPLALDFDYPVAGALILAISVGLNMWTGFDFRRKGTEIMPTSETNRKLVTDGLFRYTRNPIYLGMIMVPIGLAFILDLPIVALATLFQFLVLDLLFIPFEERKMQRQFGDEYLDYKKRVRRWL